MAVVIRFLLAVASLGGLCLVVKDFCKNIKADYLPPVTSAIVTLILFFAAYINMFGIAVNVLQILGFVYLLYWAYQLLLKKRSLADIALPSMIFFAISICMCIFFLRDAQFQNSDVYSHWGRIVKEVLSFDGFPTSQSTITINRAYPVGGALFISYLLRNAGYSNTLAIISQGIFAMAMLSAFFIGARWNKIFGIVLRLFAAIICMGGFSSTVHDLMIDYLVSLSGAAMLIIVGHSLYCEKQSEDSSLLWLMPLVVLPGMLKSSGLIFSFAGMLLIAIFILKQNDFSPVKSIKAMGIGKSALILSPIIVLVLWKSYVDHAWRNCAVEGAKFTLDVDYMSRCFSEKPFEVRLSILTENLRLLFTSTNNRYIFIAFIILIATILIFKAGKNRFYTLALSLGSGLFLIYNIGYIFMMLFLMPAKEVGWSVTLGYDRYVGVITMAICMWWLLIAISLAEKHMEQEKLALRLCCCAVMTVAIALPLKGSYRNTVFLNGVQDERRVHYDNIESVGSAVAGLYTREDKLLIYGGDFCDNDSSYNNDNYQTVFLNRNTFAFSNTTIDGGSITAYEGKLLWYFKQSDFLVILQKHESLAPLLKEHGIVFSDLDGIFYAISEDDFGTVSLNKIL